MTADLSRLSAGERRVLALLAAGHTAKSAASETGLSVHAVNERLREARRKTGAASSRELARLIGPQENRDQEIGAAATAAAGDADGAPSAIRSRRALGVPTMTLAIAGLAAAILLTQSPAPPTARPSALALHAQVRRETVDQRWAPDAEHALEAIYAPVIGVGPVEVTCGTTLCEVAGAITPGNEQAATAALQAAPLEGAIRRAGFGPRLLIEFAADRAVARGSDTRLEGEARFVVYWSRS